MNRFENTSRTSRSDCTRPVLFRCTAAPVQQVRTRESMFHSGLLHWCSSAAKKTDPIELRCAISSSRGTLHTSTARRLRSNDYEIIALNGRQVTRTTFLNGSLHGRIQPSVSPDTLLYLYSTVQNVRDNRVNPSSRRDF